MAADEVKAWIDLLRDGGPYAIIFFLGIAYWMKERYIQFLHGKIIELTVSNVTALHSMKSAVDGMAKLIEHDSNGGD